MLKNTSSFQRVYQLVVMIPVGKVATYKQLAILEGSLTPRQVGYAMANSPITWQNHKLPWHRVINSQGSVSARKHGEKDQLQQKLLIEEGALLPDRARVDFNLVGWSGPDVKWIQEHGFYLPLY